MKKLPSPRSRVSASSRPTGWRLAVVSVAFVAFVLQSFLVQTHIHFTPADTLRLADYAASHGINPGHPERDGHDKYPANEDPANCPICQEILHSGQFVTPAAQVYLPPTVAVSTIAVVDVALPVLLALSHSWRGRAPPHHI
jgi:hypothetical protein